MTDVDLGTNVLSLSGVDALSFSISNGALYFNGGANFEAKASYDVTVNVNDATVGGTPDASQSFHSHHRRERGADGGCSANTVASTPENGSDVKVADISITDDALGTNVLSLSGADAAWFSIVDGVAGRELHFIGGANYETKSFYDVTVNVNDATVGGTPDASQSFHFGISEVEADSDTRNDHDTDSTPTGTNVKVGDGDDNIISGGNGKDTLFGAGGNDTLNGNNGVDTVYGQAGNDILYGDSADDTIYGGSGDDLLFGGGGADELWGGSGNRHVCV